MLSMLESKYKSESSVLKVQLRKAPLANTEHYVPQKQDYSYDVTGCIVRYNDCFVCSYSENLSLYVMTLTPPADRNSQTQLISPQSRDLNMCSTVLMWSDVCNVSVGELCCCVTTSRWFTLLLRPHNLIWWRTGDVSGLLCCASQAVSHTELCEECV